MVIEGGGGREEEGSGCCRGSKVTYQNKNRMEYKSSGDLGAKERVRMREGKSKIVGVALPKFRSHFSGPVKLWI